MSSKKNNLTAKLEKLRRKRDAILFDKAMKKIAASEKRRKAHALAVEMRQVGK